MTKRGVCLSVGAAGSTDEMLARFRSHNSAIAFDVGAAGIRACQVAAHGEHVAVRDSLRLDLPATPNDDNGQTPFPDYSRAARLVWQGNFSGSDVALVLSPPDVRFYALRLPKNALAQPEKRVREALAWEVAREMRAEPAELEVRYWPLPLGHQQGLNVMAVALPIRQALEWHELFARDRLRLRRIDVAPCALVHLALRIWTPAENELWGVLDLGLRRATLTVVLGARPAYIRSLAASSEQWTRRLARGFEVDRAKAEQIKRAHGIQPVERAARGPQPSSALRAADSIPSIVFRLLCEPLDDLIREVNLCFAYVMQNFPDVNVSRLLLAGGGANLTGLAQYLELHLGVPVALLQSPASTGGSAEIPPTRWERPLPQAALNPEESAAVGGAILDLESA